MTGEVINCVGSMMIYMALGYLLCKTGKGVASHAKTFSGFLIYVLNPAMILNAFLHTEFSTDAVERLGLFFVITLVTQLLFFFILYLIFRKKYSDPAYRIFTVGSVMGNVGFLGLPVITGVFPEESIVACYSTMYVMSMNLLVFTIGVYLITNDKRFISVKSAILNPTTLSIFAALPLFILQVKLPAVLNDSIGLLAKMVTPVCMLVLGMRMSTVRLKSLFTRAFVYRACLMKLVVYPLFAFACVAFIPFPDITMKISVLLLSAVPSGAVINSLAELHECEQEFSANVVLMTTLMCVVTIPLFSLAVQYLL